jgi:hypothetical protein
MYPEPGLPDFRYDRQADTVTTWTPPVQTYEYMSRETIADQDRYTAGNISVRNFSDTGEIRADFARGTYAPSYDNQGVEVSAEGRSVSSYETARPIDRAVTVQVNDFSTTRNSAITPSELQQPRIVPSDLNNLPRPIETEAELRRRDMMEQGYNRMGVQIAQPQPATDATSGTSGTLPEVGIDRGPTPAGGVVEEPINTNADVNMTPSPGSRSESTTTTTTKTTVSTPAANVDANLPDYSSNAINTTSNVGNRSNVGTGNSNAAASQAARSGGGNAPAGTQMGRSDNTAPAAGTSAGPSSQTPATSGTPNTNTGATPSSGGGASDNVRNPDAGGV